MAVIRSFRAVVPAHGPGEDVSSRTAPPYDVISDDQRADLLARDPHNIVELELPAGSLDPTVSGNRYETGGRTWREWRQTGALRDDESEAIYVVEQRFELDGTTIRRRCFAVAVDLEPFSAGVILPHERTLPRALDDRMHLLRSTDANLSPVFAMFSDPQGQTDAFFLAAQAAEPLMMAVDDDGVESRVWAIRDERTIGQIVATFAERQLFIADGHHRYTTALAYRDERDADRTAGGWQASDAVLMALVNMDDPNLVVLAAHRVARAPGDFDPAGFRAGIEPYFELLDPGPDPAHVLRSIDRTAFVIRTPFDDTTTLAVLRRDVDPVKVLPGDHSEHWKRLDVSVLQELVLGPLLDIHPDRPESLDRLVFVKDADRALVVGDCDAAILIRPTRMDQLRAVALAGETMPQKSTYFYPKLLSGLLMRSLD